MEFKIDNKKIEILDNLIDYLNLVKRNNNVSNLKVPEAIKNLQIEYEKAYNLSQPEEEYVKQIAKIYADFIFIQPYEDGNKRTAMCLFNSMLMSKGIVPPPISLINDDQMVKAYYNAHEKDYEMLQSVVTEKYREMLRSEAQNREETKREESSKDIEK